MRSPELQRQRLGLQRARHTLEGLGFRGFGVGGLGGTIRSPLWALDLARPMPAPGIPCPTRTKGGQGLWVHLPWIDGADMEQSRSPHYPIIKPPLPPNITYSPHIYIYIYYHVTTTTQLYWGNCILEGRGGVTLEGLPHPSTRPPYPKP